MHTITNCDNKSTELNDDTALLQLVAIITMFIDHIGIVFFPSQIWLRVVGRMAFPLFCYNIVRGLDYTKNPLRYALRLLVFALISQYPYMLALSHEVFELNVIFTLLLGMLSIWGIKIRKRYSHILVPIICLTISALLTMDYGFRGVLLIIFMYLCRKNAGAFAAMFISFCLYWGANSYSVVNFQNLTLPPALSKLLYVIQPCFKIQSMAMLSLPLILINTDSKIKRNKVLRYIAYPAHLVLLYVLKGM